MNLYLAAVIASAFLLVLCGIVCNWLARTHRWEPAPSTWILLTTTMCLSGLMYFTSPERSWTKNVAVTAGIVNNVLILNGVMTRRSLKGLWKSFTKRQRQSVYMSSIVFSFWLVTVGTYSLLSYILVQLIGLFAYIGTVEKLLTVQKVTEPPFLWISVFLASLCALYPAVTKHDVYAMVYLGRAIPSVGGVIFLIYRARARERKQLLLALV